MSGFRKSSHTTLNLINEHFLLPIPRSLLQTRPGKALSPPLENLGQLNRLDFFSKSKVCQKKKRETILKGEAFPPLPPPPPPISTSVGSVKKKMLDSLCHYF